MWASEVARPGFADTVAALLTWAGLQARGLYLEMHEQDLPDGRAGADRPSSTGCGGWASGWRSTTTGAAGRRSPALRRLPVDTLKVDRSFIAGCLDDPADAAIVEAVAAAAAAPGRHLIASGVENRGAAAVAARARLPERAGPPDRRGRGRWTSCPTSSCAGTWTCDTFQP